MKNRTILSALFACPLLLLITLAGHAQDTARISQNALKYAGSLVTADAYAATYGDWSAYADLAPVSVLKFYGGKEGYIKRVSLARMRTTSAIQEATPELKMLLLENRQDQWQCVIRLSRYFHKTDQSQYHLVTYLVGQSKDDGETWKLFDVSYNSVANIIYIFPEIMDDIPLKESVVSAQ
jgi:hypothetical protein